MKNFGLGPEKDYLIEELSMLLAAGMPVTTALAAINKEVKSTRLKKIIDRLIAAIDAGSTITNALDSVGVFPKLTIALIRIGEQSGRLTENLAVVAIQQRRDKEFQSRLASAMIYPLFIFFLTIIVGLGVSWFILPKLAQVFSQLRISLPLITRWLIAFGQFLGSYGIVAVPVMLLALTGLLLILFVIPQTNFLGQALLFAFSPISQLFTELELARFGFLLGSLLESGMPVTDCLESLTNSAVLYRYQKFYRFLSDQVSEGNSFAKSFELYKHTGRLIPAPIQQLITSGEQSGNLAETLKKIGQLYDSKTEATAKNITVLMEPVLLVIVWLGVVAVAIAIILPLYSLIGGLNSS